MSGIITRELTMGIISLALIFVSIAAVLLYFKQQLKDRKKTVANPLSLCALRLTADIRPSVMYWMHTANTCKSRVLHRITTFSRCVPKLKPHWRKLPKHFPNPKSNICVKPKQH